MVTCTRLFWDTPSKEKKIRCSALTWLVLRMLIMGKGDRRAKLAAPPLPMRSRPSLHTKNNEGPSKWTKVKITHISSIQVYILRPTENIALGVTQRIDQKHAG